MTQNLSEAEIRSYLESKGWAFREGADNKNFQIQTCIFCQNPKWNLEVHRQDGRFSCWACGEGGNFSDFRRKNGDAGFLIRRTAQVEFARDEQQIEKLTRKAQRSYAKVWREPAALDYLRGRGFDDGAIDQFKLGASVDYEDRLWVTIPHYVGDEAVNIKYRSVTGKKEFRQEKSAAKVLFNANDLEGAKRVILVEGELKAVALWQVGFRGKFGAMRDYAVVGMVLGAGVKRAELGKKFPPEWVDALERADEIFLCLDNDEAGKASSEKIAERLGVERCRYVRLDGAKDPDEWLFEKGHTGDEFETLLRKAKAPDIKNVLPVSESLRRLAEQMDLAPETELPTSSWPRFNRIFKLRPGNLVVLAAPPKVGKTTFALNLAHFWAYDTDEPTLFLCMEMSNEELAEKTASRHTLTDEAILSSTDVLATRYDLRSVPLYFSEKVFTSDPRLIFESIRAAVRRYGIKRLVFDNLHFLCRTEDKLRERIGVVVQGFKTIASELKIPVILVAHPRKNTGRVAITSDDLRESAAIHADADIVVVMHRERVDAGEDDADDDYDPTAPDLIEDGGILSPMTEVIVDAARRGGGGKCLLFYDGARSWFRNPTADEYEEWRDGRRERAKRNNTRGRPKGGVEAR